VLSCPRCHAVFSTQAEFCGLDGTRLVETEKDPLVGAVIDRYRILEPLGEGGMASVYRAAHTTLDREYAVKLLYGEVAANKMYVERFRREAQAICKINHPNVVAVADYGTTPQGLTFLVMEMLHGVTLRRYIKDQGPLPPALAAKLARQIAEGLEAAHSLGFVHRDLKPSNVMLVGPEHATAKILDFGLVGVVDRDTEEGRRGEAKGRLTQTGNAMGTPYYMAPEQIRGDPATHATDLYALGAVLYEMLAGDPPFAGKVTEVLFKHAIEPAPRLPAAGGLEEIVARLLEKDPSRRPESAAKVIDSIDRLSLDPRAAPLVRPSSSGARASEPASEAPADSLALAVPRRPPIVLFLIGFLAAGAVAAGAVFVFGSKDAAPVEVEVFDAGMAAAEPPKPPAEEPAPVAPPSFDQSAGSLSSKPRWSTQPRSGASASMTWPRSRVPQSRCGASAKRSARTTRKRRPPPRRRCSSRSRRRRSTSSSCAADSIGSRSR
jgi:serine/threonine-protein kinase